MPKGIDLDKVAKEIAKRLAASGDDVAGAGRGLLDEIAETVKQLSGKGPKSPTAPKNPPKSGRGKTPPAAGAVTPAPKGPKPKSPKSGTADKIDREAKRQANRDAWAKEREAYNKMKSVEREERKAANRAKWAATLEEKYGGNIVEARKATSKGASKGKKKGAK